MVLYCLKCAYDERALTTVHISVAGALQVIYGAKPTHDAGPLPPATSLPPGTGSPDTQPRLRLIVIVLLISIMLNSCMLPAGYLFFSV